MTNRDQHPNPRMLPEAILKALETRNAQDPTPDTDHECGALCTVHGDPRDTNVDPNHGEGEYEAWQMGSGR